jgi:hypothetical protein
MRRLAFSTAHRWMPLVCRGYCCMLMPGYVRCIVEGGLLDWCVMQPRGCQFVGCSVVDVIKDIKN